MAKKVPGIVLVQLPPWDPRTVPLGIGYVAGYLKSKGVRYALFDLNSHIYAMMPKNAQKGWGNEDFHWWRSSRLEERYLAQFDSYVDMILAYGLPVVGFSATLPSIPFLNHLAKRIKNKAPRTTIIVGGPAPFFKEVRDKDFEQEVIDYFVIGDGERALYDLLRGLKPDGRFTVPRFSPLKVWKEEASPHALCVEAPRVMDLSRLPLPSFDGLDLTQYTEGSLSRDFTLPIIFSKGCTRRCTFCSDYVLSHPYRVRTPKNVVREMQAQIRRYGNKKFRLNDLSFNAHLKFLNELCDRIIQAKLSCEWYGQAQVRPDMDKKLLKKLRKAGCVQFSLGLESFSDRVLALMRKNYTSDQAVRFLKDSKEAGIRNDIAIIVGYPGETEEDFDLTLKAIEHNAQYINRICSLNICGMPVGSELRSEPEKFQYFISPHNEWITSDYVSTHAVRRDRYNKIIQRCNQIGMPVDACLDLAIFEEQFKPESA